MPARFVGAIVAGLIFIGCGSELLSPSTPTTTAGEEQRGAPQARCANVVWSADHETGDLSQWYVGGGGGEFNSGAATSSASQDVARSGRYSARAIIETPHIPDESGVRLFRWHESGAYPEACYSAWYYFPRRFIVTVWWNIFQFKSRNGDVANDAFWSLQIGNRPGGAMHLYLRWGDQVSIDGPHRGQFGGRPFGQTVKDIPVGRWTHIEGFLRQSSEFDGQIIVSQDGVELFNLNNVRTRYAAANGANQWSANNYSDSIVPSPTTIYIDDATITTARLGPPPVGAMHPAVP